MEVTFLNLLLINALQCAFFQLVIYNKIYNITLKLTYMKIFNRLCTIIYLAWIISTNEKYYTKQNAHGQQTGEAKLRAGGVSGDWEGWGWREVSKMVVPKYPVKHIPNSSIQNIITAEILEFRSSAGCNLQHESKN